MNITNEFIEMENILLKQSTEEKQAKYMEVGRLVNKIISAVVENQELDLRSDILRINVSIKKDTQLIEPLQNL